MKKKYPVIDMEKTGQNIKHIMQMRGMNVRDIQEFLKLSTPQSIYHWFDGRSLPTLDNLYALSELFRLPLDAFIKGNRQFDGGKAQDVSRQRLVSYYNRLMRLKTG